MNTWNPKANEIFLDALDRESEEQRRAFLEEACQGDAGLWAEVESLLSADQDASRMLDQAGVCLMIDEGFAERVGETIGPYTLREPIGEGGMGVVYVAEQSTPIRRKVALKIIKTGLASEELTARFEAEGQALAMMDHPNIAKVFDGGVDEKGRPYIALELVHGLPIHEFCDQHEMSTHERLRRFLDVCRAVQHAHQKGIIHRDLKPSNVLVAEIDDMVVAKVIDFGVAKAVGQETIDRTLNTSFDRMIGTPLYMSPEQTRMGVVDVDTRSDVYSLGVLLYELLTGSTPFASEELKKAGFDEMRRIIQEEEPSRPSKQVSTLSDEASSTVAERRSIDHRQLSNTLQRELDWIVMKALAKDRDRRYQSAAELAEDIECYLRNEPVQAHPPSFVYRFDKFVHRNAGFMTAVAVVLLCLVGGIIGTTWGMVQARRERDAARIAQTNERAVLDFVEQRIFAAVRPGGHDGGLGHDATLRQAIEAALPYLQTSFEEQPLLKARLHETIGVSFIALGEGELAVNQFQDAYAIRSELLGPDDMTTLQSMTQLAFGYDEVGNYDKALELKQKVLARRRAILGADHRDTAASMIDIAVTHNRQQQYGRAAELLRTAFASLNVNPEADHELLFRCMVTLASSYRNLGRFEDAAKYHLEAFELTKRTKGIDHPDTLGTMHEFAHSHQATGREPEANALLQKTLDLQRDKLGPGHPNTLETAHCLARSHMKLRNHKEAKDTFEIILQMQKDSLGHNDPATLDTMSRLAISYFKLGEYGEAARRHEEVFKLRRDWLGENDLATLSSLGELALCKAELQKYDEAIESLARLVSKLQEVHGPDHRETIFTTYNLAKVCWVAGKIEDAVGHYEDVIRRMENNSGPEYPQTLDCINYYAWLLTTVPDYHDPSRALTLAKDLVQASPRNPWYLRTLGAAQLRNELCDDAVDSLTRSMELRNGAGNCTDFFLLAISEAKRGNIQDARYCYETAIKAMDQVPRHNNPEFIRYRAEANQVVQIDTTDSAISDDRPSSASRDGTQESLERTNNTH